MTVTLRPQQDTDVPVLVDLAQRSWQDVERAVDAVLGTPLDRLVTPSWRDHHAAVVEEACASPTSTVVVAEVAGDIVGFVAHRVHDESPGMSRYGEIEVIAVDPDHRGAGVGRRLLDRAIADLRAASVPVMMLATGGDEGHGPARALYEAAGFQRLPTAQYWLPGAEG